MKSEPTERQPNARHWDHNQEGRPTLPGGSTGPWEKVEGDVRAEAGVDSGRMSGQQLCRNPGNFPGRRDRCAVAWALGSELQRQNSGSEADGSQLEHRGGKTGSKQVGSLRGLGDAMMSGEEEQGQAAEKVLKVMILKAEPLVPGKAMKLKGREEENPGNKVKEP